MGLLSFSVSLMAKRTELLSLFTNHSVVTLRSRNVTKAPTMGSNVANKDTDCFGNNAAVASLVQLKIILASLIGSKRWHEMNLVNIYLTAYRKKNS